MLVSREVGIGEVQEEEIHRRIRERGARGIRHVRGARQGQVERIQAEGEATGERALERGQRALPAHERERVGSTPARVTEDRIEARHLGGEVELVGENAVRLGAHSREQGEVGGAVSVGETVRARGSAASARRPSTDTSTTRRAGRRIRRVSCASSSGEPRMNAYTSPAPAESWVRRRSTRASPSASVVSAERDSCPGPANQTSCPASGRPSVSITSTSSMLSGWSRPGSPASPRPEEEADLARRTVDDEGHLGAPRPGFGDQDAGPAPRVLEPALRVSLAVGGRARLGRHTPPLAGHAEDDLGVRDRSALRVERADPEGERRAAAAPLPLPSAAHRQQRRDAVLGRGRIGEQCTLPARGRQSGEKERERTAGPLHREGTSARTRSR